jgi:hypothetical protein
LSPAQKERLDRDGHLALPALMTPSARDRLTASLERILAVPEPESQRARHYSAERDPYLADLLGHPQMLDLARSVLGPDLRFDHCVELNRPPTDQGAAWHSHEYADDRPDLGFVRIFLYVNGFESDDGGLKVVPGSHLFRDSRLSAPDDAALKTGWLAGRRHPLTGEPLRIESLTAPPGTVVLMWTHAAHAVTPRKPGSATRWTVVYAYRNPGEPSRARWISEAFERNPPPGYEGLMGLY